MDTRSRAKARAETDANCEAAEWLASRSRSNVELYFETFETSSNGVPSSSSSEEYEEDEEDGGRCLDNDLRRYCECDGFLTSSSDDGVDLECVPVFDEAEEQQLAVEEQRLFAGASAAVISLPASGGVGPDPDLQPFPPHRRRPLPPRSRPAQFGVGFGWCCCGQSSQQCLMQYFACWSDGFQMRFQMAEVYHDNLWPFYDETMMRCAWTQSQVEMEALARKGLRPKGLILSTQQPVWHRCQLMANTSLGNLTDKFVKSFGGFRSMAIQRRRCCKSPLCSIQEEDSPDKRRKLDRDFSPGVSGCHSWDSSQSTVNGEMHTAEKTQLALPYSKSDNLNRLRKWLSDVQ